LVGNMDAQSAGHKSKLIYRNREAVQQTP
jgi:hypothetical protein